MVQSSLHFGLVELFRIGPELAVELAEPTDRTADGLIVLEGPKPAVVIVEVQIARDKEKPERWLSYVLSARLRYRCQVVLLVVTPSASVARWASRAIEVGAGMRLRPVVVGPREIPPMRSAAEAEERPLLSVLSALAHPRDAAVVETAIESALGLLGDAAPLYWDLIYDSVDPAEKRRLEERMAANSMKYEFKSPFARSYFDAGKAEGQALGKAHAVLAILRARGLPVPASARDRIEAEMSEPLLDAWLVRAISAECASDLFG